MSINRILQLMCVRVWVKLGRARSIQSNSEHTKFHLHFNAIYTRTPKIGRRCLVQMARNVSEQMTETERVVAHLIHERK